MVLVEHQPVLLKEVLEYLDPNPSKTYVDCTLGAGGHSSAILDKLAGQGCLYSLDQDLSAIELVRSNMEELNPKHYQNWVLTHENFANLENFYLKQKSINPNFKIDGGILLDLGLSSMQLDQAHRGFSFSKEAELDMRMNLDDNFRAADLINRYPERQIADILYKYGDERLSRQIARAIVLARPISTTTELAEIVKRVYVQKTKSSKTFHIHPATRTFQALRVFVNQELQALESILEATSRLLEPKARIVVISFQSQEDRLVKHCLKQKHKFELLTKKPLVPSPEEEQSNPRSRSAKLRAAIIKDHEQH